MRPPIIWQEPGADWAAALRGRRYFQGLRFWNGPRVQITRSGGMLAVSRSTVFFLYMPIDRPEGHALVADVTADVLGLLPKGSVIGPMQRAWEEAMTPDAITYWRSPEVLRGHAAVLQASTLIMTSWAEMVEPLFEFANCPVVHVPDYRGRWGWAFRRGIRQVWRELEASRGSR